MQSNEFCDALGCIIKTLLMAQLGRCWFGILSRRLLKRGSFTSTEVLNQRILAFIEFFNETLAKPFRWTYYIGKPLLVWVIGYISEAGY